VMPILRARLEADAHASAYRHFIEGRGETGAHTSARY
jgi:hypothetical protein